MAGASDRGDEDSPPERRDPVQDIQNADVFKLQALEEQDTYNLYCPKCNYCIARRVILVMPLEPVPVPRPDVIKCLKCCSFSIPPGGFSILRTFNPRPIDPVAGPSEIPVPGTQRKGGFDLLKSIVYGGLIESIISLGVVSSAVGSDASTLKIVAVGLANLFGGLFIFGHNLWELKRAPEDSMTDQNREPTGRNFWLHAAVAISSFILFGMLPPLIYGFSFRESDNEEYKLIAVAGVSFFCIAILAVGKAHVTSQSQYCKILSSYLSVAVTASALPYIAGATANRLLTELGWFDNSSAAPAPPLMYAHFSSMTPARATL